MRLIVLAIAAALLVAGGVIGALLHYDEDVALAWITPKKKADGQEPPAAPDYRKVNAWLIRGAGSAGRVDVFFIHANDHQSRKTWNGALYSPEEQPLGHLQEVVMPVDAGPFAELGPLWVPSYRQPSLFTRFAGEERADAAAAARDLALGDITSAFQVFLKARDPERPFVVAGYGDGALFAARLMRDIISRDRELRGKLVAAYALGLPLHESAFRPLACRELGQPRCLIALTPIDRQFGRYRTWLSNETLTAREEQGYQPTGRGPLLCTYIDFEGAEGRLMGLKPAPDSPLQQIEQKLRPVCEDGLLVYETPDDQRVEQPERFGRYVLPDGINPIYGALARDARSRADNLRSLLVREEENAQVLPAFEPAEDVNVAPVKTVPTAP
ncbi:MAG: DUF3089 domain-containing protein [Pseudomonadota bacterium]